MDNYTNRFRMLARELYSLDDIRKRHAQYLELRVSEAQESRLEELANLLEQHRGGNCPLVIRYLQKQHTAKIVPDSRWRLVLSEKLLQGLRAVLTAENVVIGYK